MKNLRQQLLLCLVLNVLIYQGIAAQPDFSKKNNLGLSLGISNYHSKDLILSPLIYRGNNFDIDLSYLHKRTKSLHTLELSFTIGDINSNVPFQSQTGVRAHIWYGYSRQITTFSIKDTSIPIFIGGLLKSYVDSAFPQDFDNGTWISTHSLNINFATQYRINPRHSFYWELHFPMLSYVVRPPYAGSDVEFFENIDKPLKVLLTQNGKFAATNEYFMLFNRFAYLYSLSPKFDFVVKYQFSYHQYDQPRDVKTFINLFSTGLVLKF